MQWFLVITVIAALVNLSQPHPHHHVEWQTASVQTWPLVAPNIVHPVQSIAAPVETLPFKTAEAQVLLDPSLNPTFFPVIYNTIPVYQAPLEVLKGKSPTPAAKENNKRKNNAEPTTRPPKTNRPGQNIQSEKLINKVQKLEDEKQQKKENSKLITADLQLLTAIQQPNSNFIVEKIIPIPGTKVLQTTSLEPIDQGFQNKSAEEDEVKVTATGSTAVGKPIPNIPVGVFFNPYSSALGDTPNKSGKKEASLILEPSAKAVVGNGGTAFSVPVARAVLKKGTPARVLFRPQSVAIAGVGGKAHAQADLFLDFVNRK